MTVNNDVSLYTNYYETVTETEEQNKVYISQDLLDEAKNISSSSEYAGLVYDDQVVAINESNVNTLQNLFGSDLVQYEDIYIATNDAQSYMQEVEAYVYNNLNTTENLSINDTVDITSVLSPELYSLIANEDGTYEDASYISINDIINLQISANTTGELSNTQTEIALESYEENSTLATSNAETSTTTTASSIASNVATSTTSSSTTSSSSGETSSSSSSTTASGGASGVSGTSSSSSTTESELEELYAQLAKIEQQIANLQAKLSGAEEEEVQSINQQIASLNNQAAVIMAEIQSLLGESTE